MISLSQGHREEPSKALASGRCSLNWSFSYPYPNLFCSPHSINPSLVHKGMESSHIPVMMSLAPRKRFALGRVVYGPLWSPLQPLDIFKCNGFKQNKKPSLRKNNTVTTKQYWQTYLDLPRRWDQKLSVASPFSLPLSTSWCPCGVHFSHRILHKDFSEYPASHWVLFLSVVFDLLPDSDNSVGQWPHSVHFLCETQSRCLINTLGQICGFSWGCCPCLDCCNRQLLIFGFIERQKCF